jgi:hypothetical protein
LRVRGRVRTKTSEAFDELRVACVAWKRWVAFEQLHRKRIIGCKIFFWTVRVKLNLL